MQIPDRMCAHPRSKHFHDDHPAVRISVDGQEYTGRVVEFCRSKGWARVLVMDPRTGKAMKAIDGKSDRIRRIHGNVIVWLAGTPPPADALKPLVMQ